MKNPIIHNLDSPILLILKKSLKETTQYVPIVSKPFKLEDSILYKVVDILKS